MITKTRKAKLEKQAYRLAGNHSVVKVCLWAKNKLRNKGTCYKHKFYGIKSWRCVQMSPVLDLCNLKCRWCWRDIDYKGKKLPLKLDSPKDIINSCIEEHKELLQGFLGEAKTKKKIFEEAMKPMHFAISLTGEATFYPYLPELIDEINKRGFTSFLVSNGTNPKMINKLVKHQPTQIYITLPAPDKETYEKICSPLIKNGWENIIKSLKLLKHFKRSCIRLTLAKNMNLVSPEKYGKLLKPIKFNFLELKSAMPVGYARYRMTYAEMPSFFELNKFSKELCKHAGLKIINRQKVSTVVLAVPKKTNKKNIKLQLSSRQTRD